MATCSHEGERNRSRTGVIYYADAVLLQSQAQGLRLDEVRRLAIVLTLDVAGSTLGVAAESTDGLRDRPRRGWSRLRRVRTRSDPRPCALINPLSMSSPSVP